MRMCELVREKKNYLSQKQKMEARPLRGPHEEEPPSAMRAV